MQREPTHSEERNSHNVRAKISEKFYHNDDDEIDSSSFSDSSDESSDHSSSNSDSTEESSSVINSDSPTSESSDDSSSENNTEQTPKKASTKVNDQSMNISFAKLKNLVANQRIISNVEAKDFKFYLFCAFIEFDSRSVFSYIKNKRYEQITCQPLENCEEDEITADISDINEDKTLTEDYYEKNIIFSNLTPTLLRRQKKTEDYIKKNAKGPENSDDILRYRVKSALEGKVSISDIRFQINNNIAILESEIRKSNGDDSELEEKIKKYQGWIHELDEKIQAKQEEKAAANKVNKAITDPKKLLRNELSKRQKSIVSKAVEPAKEVSNQEYQNMLNGLFGDDDDDSDDSDSL